MSVAAYCLRRGAHHRGVLAVLLGGGRQDRAQDVDGLRDPALAQQALDLVHGGGDIGLLGHRRRRRDRGRLGRGVRARSGQGGVRPQEGARGIQGRPGGRPARGQKQRQVLVHLLRGRRPVLRVLGEQPQHQGLQRLGHLGAEPAHGQRGLVQVPVQHAERGGAGERHLAAEQFVHQHAERVQVGVRADRAAHRLFRRHVGGRADRRAGVREAGGVGVHHRGHAQVEDGDRAVLLHHHVARLEVAVHDRHGVHGAQYGAQLRSHRDRPRPGVRVVLGEMVGEVGAVDVLHDEEQLLALAARVVHRHQTRVVHLRGHPALAHEPAAQLVRLLARHLVGAQQLHRHAPVEPAVVRRPDLAHAALPDERGQFVTVGDHAPCRHRHRPPSPRLSRPSWPSRPSCRRR